MSPVDIPLIGDIACRAVLAMCARGLALTEFEASPELQSFRLTIDRPLGLVVELPIELEFFGRGGVPIGGMSL